MEVVDDPKQYLSHHRATGFKIVQVESRELTSLEEWLKITSPDSPDIHTKSYLTQIQYHINGTRGHYLQVTDSGDVKANSQKNNARTFFTVIHDFLNNEYCYQIIGYNQKYMKMILYMDGDQLRTRLSNQRKDEKDDATKFIMQTKGNCGSQPYEILSKKTNTPLRFDNQGNFVPNETVSNDLDPPYHFKISIVDQMKVTSL